MKPIAVLCVVLALPCSASAQAPVKDRVSVDEAVQEAVEQNLGLLAEKYNIAVADARIITARLRPNPVFSAGADYLDWLGAGFSLSNNTGPSEVNYRGDFTLERGGKRGARIDSAQKARAVVEQQLLNSARLLALEVRNACVDLLLAKENVGLSRENLTAFEEMVRINSSRVDAGDLAPIELVRTRVAALQARNAVVQNESRLRAARTRLQGLMGRTTFSPTFDVAGDLERTGEAAPLELMKRAALEGRPDLRALVLDRERAEAEVRSQLAQGKPDFTVGAQVHHQFGAALTDPGASLGLFFSAPIPVFNRNQGEIERARQELRQVQARVLALTADIGREVDAAYNSYQTARDLLDSIRKDMLEQARQVRETTGYSYRRGEASFVEFLDAQRAFNDTVQAYNEARAEYLRNLYVLDSISGKGVKP